MFEGTLNCKLSNFRQGIIDIAMDQRRKHLQACVRANRGHYEHLLWTNSCKQLAFFHVFFVQVASAQCMVSDFYSVGCLMVDRPTLLNCKALSLLRTVNETKSKMLVFCILLICTYFDDIWHTVGQMIKVTFETCFTCTKSAKFLILSFPR